MIYVKNGERDLKKKYSEDKRYTCVKTDAGGYYFELVTVAYNGVDPLDVAGYRKATLTN